MISLSMHKIFSSLLFGLALTVMSFMIEGICSAELTTKTIICPNKTIDYPPIKKIAPGVFRLGQIQIHKRARSITFPATVNMDKGLIEYLIVKSSGKTHESLLRTDVDPYYLNIAFLLLGFEGTDKPLSVQGASERPRGEQVEIQIVYKRNGKNEKIPAENWLIKKLKEKDVIPKLDWIYTGSQILHGSFLAQEQGSIVAIYHDPAALIDNTDPAGNNDEIWFVRQEVVPPVGTEVTVIIKAKRR